MNLVKGATVLATRISEVRRGVETKQTSSRGLARRDGFLCVECGGPILEVLATLGSLRCHDCRSARPQD